MAECGSNPNRRREPYPFHSQSCSRASINGKFLPWVKALKARVICNELFIELRVSVRNSSQLGVNRSTVTLRRFLIYFWMDVCTEYSLDFFQRNEGCSLHRELSLIFLILGKSFVISMSVRELRFKLIEGRVCVACVISHAQFQDVSL
jgi:hypothetical protein